MNYQRIHDQIIDRAKSENRIKNNGIYYEKHHILPRCLGGNNSKDNLVLLTAREHFLIHWLLYRIYDDNDKIMYAFNIMCNRFTNKSSNTYKEVKEIFSKKMSYSKLGKKGRPMQEWHKKIISNLHKGKIVSEETKLKQSKTRKGIGRPHHDWVKLKLSENSGKVSPILQFTLENIFIREWKSISSAQRSGNKGAISACCRNIRKTAGDYIWKYKNKI